MNKFILIFLFLTGCSTHTVIRPFPDTPPALKQGCEELEMLDESTHQLSMVLQNVTSNYAKYHECKLKVEAWQEWYKFNKGLK